MWGPNGEISDYAAKPWSGLLRDYYHGRWRIYLESLVESVRAGVPLDDGMYMARLMAFEKQWNNATGMRANEHPT
jgi:hypothetical protein